MSTYVVTRGHLKEACENAQWDVLDLLLETDPTHLNDPSMFGDGWGLWCGLLLRCIYQDQVDGVRVLLKHGADRELASWGDGMTETPLEAAAGKPAILELLSAPGRPEWIRDAATRLPASLGTDGEAANAQGRIAAQTGLVFDPSAIPPAGEP